MLLPSRPLHAARVCSSCSLLQTLEDKLKAVEDELAHCRLRAPSEGSGPVQEVLCRLEQLEGELRKAHDIKKQVTASFEEQLRQSAAQLQEAEAQLQETETQLQDVSARCKALQEDAEARLSAELAEKAELQRQVASEQQQRARAEEKLAKEIAEWKLYESDLLRTVRVADSIKAESEEEAERLAKENEGLQVRCRRLTSCGRWYLPRARSFALLLVKLRSQAHTRLAAWPV